MIARTWTGWVDAAKAADYERYMHEVAIGGYERTPGNRGVLMLRRDLDDGRVEFLMVTLWDSMEAVRAFAGDDPSVAVFYDRDDEFLVDRQREVPHYQVYGASAQFTSPPAAHPATGD